MTTFLVAKNLAEGTLSADIDDNDLSLVLESGEGAEFPSTYPYHVVIGGSEIVSVTNRSTDTLTITRAQESTTAGAHVAGESVVLAVSAAYVTELQTAVTGIEAGTTMLAAAWIADDADLFFGTDKDIRIRYDEATDNRLEFHDGTNLLAWLTDNGTTGTFGVTGGIDASAGVTSFFPTPTAPTLFAGASSGFTMGHASGANKINGTVTIQGSAAAFNCDSSGHSACTIDRGNTSSVCYLGYYTAGVAKWWVGMRADANNQFIIGETYNNTGHLTITTSTGLVTLAGDLTVSGGDIIGGVSATTQGTLKLFHGGGGNTPAYVQLYSPNGTAHYIFVEDDGTLKQHTSAPTANTDGNVVGAQT